MVHVGVGLAGSRGDQRGKSCAVCPIRIQIEPPHLHSPLSSFARWRADLLSTGDKSFWRAGTTRPFLYVAFLWVGNDSQSLVPIPRTNKSLTRHFAATSKLPPPWAGSALASAQGAFSHSLSPCHSSQVNKPQAIRGNYCTCSCSFASMNDDFLC